MPPTTAPAAEPSGPRGAPNAAPFMLPAVAPASRPTPLAACAPTSILVALGSCATSRTCLPSMPMPSAAPKPRPNTEALVGPVGVGAPAGMALPAPGAVAPDALNACACADPPGPTLRFLTGGMGGRGGGGMGAAAPGGGPLLPMLTVAPVRAVPGIGPASFVRRSRADPDEYCVMAFWGSGAGAGVGAVAGAGAVAAGYLGAPNTNSRNFWLKPPPSFLLGSIERAFQTDKQFGSATLHLKPPQGQAYFSSVEAASTLMPASAA